MIGNRKYLGNAKRRERDSNPRYPMGTPAFEAGAIDLSAISPWDLAKASNAAGLDSHALFSPVKEQIVSTKLRKRLYFLLWRRALKNSLNKAAAASANTPPVISSRWLKRGSSAK
jgi:hypothetical protein